jgi:hypothetical protein
LNTTTIVSKAPPLDPKAGKEKEKEEKCGWKKK